MLGAFGGQVHHNPGEDTVAAPALPPVIEGLRGPVLSGCITVLQHSTIGKDYAAEEATICNARLVVDPTKESL